MTDVERMRMWILNEESLYLALRYASAVHGRGDHAVQYMKDVVEIALDIENLTPFQLEFMPNMDSWEMRAMISELIEEEQTS